MSIQHYTKYYLPVYNFTLAQLDVIHQYIRGARASSIKRRLWNLLDLRQPGLCSFLALLFIYEHMFGGLYRVPREGGRQQKPLVGQLVVLNSSCVWASPYMHLGLEAKANSELAKARFVQG